ncbi:MAG TPA: PIG-L family deacetylase [Terriglobales bacterium]|nr:PIG-L family deacetylase [Terriglobales bacterium]
MDSLHPLLGRTLVLVAHPDDEVVGCGILLQRMREPIVVFATDGAPRSDYFWKQHGSRENYARIRRNEAEQALNAIGLHHQHRLCEENLIADQELFLNLECAYNSLSDLVEMEIPDAILTLAYEGGHPDHDCCAFLASVVGIRYELPVWEAPLYHRAGNDLVRQKFLNGAGLPVFASAEELARKRQMFAAYASQAQVVANFTPEFEFVRPMHEYDFTCAPHTGVLNYEAWKWPMRGTDLCRAFSQFLTQPADPTRKREWGTAA